MEKNTNRFFAFISIEFRNIMIDFLWMILYSDSFLFEFQREAWLISKNGKLKAEKQKQCHEKSFSMFASNKYKNKSNT